MKNTTILFGIIGIIAAAGIIYYVTITKTPTILETATTTPVVVVTETPKPTTTINEKEAGAPIVTTSSSVGTSEFAASVSGTVVPRGYFTNYWFEYGLTENLGQKTMLQNIGSGYIKIASPGYITGLSKNTTYYFRLVAENQYGKTLGNRYVFKTNPGNPAPIGKLPTVKTLAGSAISKTSATLQGEVTPNQSTTQYWFEYGKTSDLGNTSDFKTISSTTTKTQVSLSLTELDPLTTYYFRINAQNQWGTVNGLTQSFKTSSPTDISKPTANTNSANNVKATSATLRGTVNPNGLETIYWFEYSTDSLLGSALLKTTQHVSSGSGKSNLSFTANITNLASSTNYFYHIVAQNSLGISYGDRASFKTK